MKSNPGVAATVFETLAAADINIEMISTSAIRISCVVRQDRVEEAVQVLHDAFELGTSPPTPEPFDPTPTCSRVSALISAR